MAMEVNRRIVNTVTLDSSNFERGANRVITTLNDLRGSSDLTTQHLNRLQNGLNDFGGNGGGNNGALRVADSFNELQSSVNRASLVVNGALLLMGGAMVKYASDLEETLNKINVVFKDNAKEIEDWSKTSIQNMGMAQQSAMDMAALFGDMGSSMGIEDDLNAQMAKQITQRAADMASFKNIRIDVAKTALASIYTSETESLKQQGVIMTQAALQQYAYANGINKKIIAMTENEKIMLRYNFVMEKTANAEGDFAETSDGAANQMRMFQENLKELAATFGKEILPAFSKGVKAVNDLIVKFSAMPKSVKSFIMVKALIIGVSLAVASLTLNVYSSVAALKLMTANLATSAMLQGLTTGFKSAALAVKAFTLANAGALIGIGLLAVGLGLLVKHFYDYEQGLQKAQISEKKTIGFYNQLIDGTYSLAEAQEFLNSSKFKMFEQNKEMIDADMKQLREYEKRRIEGEGGIFDEATFKGSMLYMDMMKKYNMTQVEYIAFTNIAAKKTGILTGEYQKAAKDITDLTNKVKILNDENEKIGKGIDEAISIQNEKQKVIDLINEYENLVNAKKLTKEETKRLNVVQDTLSTIFGDSVQISGSAETGYRIVASSLTKIKEEAIKAVDAMYAVEKAQIDVGLLNKRQALRELDADNKAKEAYLKNNVGKSGDSGILNRVNQDLKVGLETNKLLEKDLKKQIEDLNNDYIKLQDGFYKPSNITDKSGSGGSGGGSKKTFEELEQEKTAKIKKEIDIRFDLEQISHEQKIKLYNDLYNKTTKSFEHSKRLLIELNNLNKDLVDEQVSDYMQNIKYLLDLGIIEEEEFYRLMKVFYDTNTKYYAKNTKAKMDLIIELHNFEIKQQEKAFEKYKETLDKANNDLKDKNKQKQDILKEQYDKELELIDRNKDEQIDAIQDVIDKMDEANESQDLERQIQKNLALMESYRGSTTAAGIAKYEEAAQKVKDAQDKITKNSLNKQIKNIENQAQNEKFEAEKQYEKENNLLLNEEKMIDDNYKLILEKTGKFNKDMLNFYDVTQQELTIIMQNMGNTILEVFQRTVETGTKMTSDLMSKYNTLLGVGNMFKLADQNNAIQNNLTEKVNNNNNNINIKIDNVNANNKNEVDSLLKQIESRLFRDFR